MYTRFLHPESMKGEELDTLLAQGWFRMGGSIHTSHILLADSRLFNVVRLRYDLRRFRFGKTFKNLSRRNSDTVVTFHPFAINPEREELFRQYREERFNDDEVGLELYLHHPQGKNPYESLSVDVHLEGRLIASGVMDLGDKASAGILSFFDLDLRERSLGKWVIYNMVQYAIGAGLDFFYPGYHLPGNSKFEYKMDIGGAATEFYRLHEDKWLDWTDFTTNDMRLELMRDKLDEVQRLLFEEGLTTVLVYYFQFDRPMATMSVERKFDFPFFVVVRPTADLQLQYAICYDLLQCELQAYKVEGDPKFFLDGEGLELWYTEAQFLPRALDGFLPHTVAVVLAEL
jgi:arginine-tRNA-protein transferase